MEAVGEPAGKNEEGSVRPEKNGKQNAELFWRDGEFVFERGSGDGEGAAVDVRDEERKEEKDEDGPKIGREFFGMRSGLQKSYPELLCYGVAGAADGVDAREAHVHGRKCGKLRVRFGLIPVRHGKEIVGTNVGVAVFDGGANGFCERDRRIEMEAVNGRAAAREFGTFYGRAHER